LAPELALALPLTLALTLTPTLASATTANDEHLICKHYNYSN
jgi:hypothetical protein